MTVQDDLRARVERLAAEHPVPCQNRVCRPDLTL